MMNLTKAAPSARANSDTESVLDVRELKIDFDLGDGHYPVVEHVSLRLDPGERLAVVGESGSGKTVTALSLMGLLPQIGRLEAEHLEVAGHEISRLNEKQLDKIRGSDVAMIFQDPMSSLNPVLRIERQLVAPIRRHRGLNAEEARNRAIGLLARVGIPSPSRVLRSYPHELSGGMRQRVMIAMAVSCEPRLLLADEPTTALDVTIQAQILDLLTELTDDLGIGCVLVTHDLGVVARFAHRVAVMYAGRIVEHGPIRQIFEEPRHPYTRALLGSVPSPESSARLTQIDGAPPGLKHRGDGCAFAPRCPLAMESCVEAVPPLLEIEPRHTAACYVTAGGKADS